MAIFQSCTTGFGGWFEHLPGVLDGILVLGKKHVSSFFGYCFGAWDGRPSESTPESWIELLHVGLGLWWRLRCRELLNPFHIRSMGRY